MIDDINRGQMQKGNFDEDQKVDYIYCLRYGDDDAVKTNFQALEVIDDTTGTGTGTVECNLSQRHRSSQEILDFVDYLFRHSYHRPVRKYDSISSFSSEIVPLWIEIADPNTFFVYFKHRFENYHLLISTFFKPNILVISNRFFKYFLNLLFFVRFFCPYIAKADDY